MGLLTIIKKQKIKDKEIRCLVLGLDNSGKSTIVNNILPASERNESITPTVGFQIHSVQIHSKQDSQDYTVSMWDVGGQRTLRPFWDNYFDKTDVLVWCIDISSPIRFDESFRELKELVTQDKDRIGYQCKLIVALNKCDLIQPSPKFIEELTHDIQSQIESMLSQGTGQSNIATYVLCSGITGTGIDMLCRQIVTKKTV
ncbi:hypothetical protein RNJ44_01410 [Nakaseomyces bracarensis]|uniref:Uncharacterized protein n=1 Tax=Nakaseomyces bracarensis TaxID=273131 RepID=A0ABR4NPM0_9SACH